MGKAEIISAPGLGAYQIKLLFDRRRVDDEKAKLQKKIDELEERISEIIEFPSQRDAVYKLIIEQDALESKINELNRLPEDPVLDVWCADFTEDLQGTVGTIEIIRERDVGILLRPGYNADPWDPQKDGQQQHAIGTTAWACFFNMAVLPGVQKFLPRYRCGRITEISEDMTKCEINLDACENYGAISSAQELYVNVLRSLSNVPFKYMTCNGAVFRAGDEVVVKFKKHDWEQPEVIGFKQNPKPCSITFYLKPTFNNHSPVLGNERIQVRYTDRFGAEKTITKLVYGTLYPAPRPELEGYSELFEIPGEDVGIDTKASIEIYVGATRTYTEAQGNELDEFAFQSLFTFWYRKGYPSSSFFCTGKLIREQPDTYTYPNPIDFGDYVQVEWKFQENLEDLTEAEVAWQEDGKTKKYKYREINFNNLKVMRRRGENTKVGAKYSNIYKAPQLLPQHIPIVDCDISMAGEAENLPNPDYLFENLRWSWSPFVDVAHYSCHKDRYLSKWGGGYGDYAPQYYYNGGYWILNYFPIASNYKCVVTSEGDEGYKVSFYDGWYGGTGYHICDYISEYNWTGVTYYHTDKFYVDGVEKTVAYAGQKGLSPAQKMIITDIYGQNPQHTDFNSQVQINFMNIQLWSSTGTNWMDQEILPVGSPINSLYTNSTWYFEAIDTPAEFF